MTRIVDGQYVDFDHVSDVIKELKRLEPIVGEVADDQELEQFINRHNHGRLDELTESILQAIITDVLIEKTGF
jgi:hypothetical protein